MKSSANICKRLALSLFLACLAIGLSKAQPSNCTPKPAGLVSWWKAEGNGLDNIGGNTAYAALVPGGVTFAAGEVGQAFQLDNTNAFLVVPASPSLNVGSGSGFTMEGWIKVASVSGLHPIAEWHGSTRITTGVNLWLNSNPYQSGSLFASIIETNETEHRLASADGMVQPNVFQHVALTYDKGSGVAALYLNGAIVAQSNIGSVVPATTADFWIAHRTLDVPGDWTYGATLGGLLDELSLYNRALGSNEIVAIYNAGAAGKCDGTISGLAPAITQQPTNQTVATGGNATFAVTATGTGPLHYLWYGPANTLIPGATNSTLTLSNVQQVSTGNYFVLVTNSLGSVQSSNAVLTVTGGGNGSNSCSPPPSGLVAWWKGDGNTLDSAGNNEGSVAGGSITYLQGEVNQSFNFDGGSYIQVPDGPRLHFTNTMTIEAWINLSSLNGNYQEILSKYAGADLNQNSYTITIEPGGHLRFNVVSTNYPINQFVLSSTTIPLHQWVHVAGVDDGTSLKVYLNGQFSGSIPWNGGIFGGNQPLTIGCTMQANPVSFFNGKIDEVSLYNRALGANEIAAIYNAGAAGKCDGASSGLAPAITQQPTNHTVATGGNATFMVTTTGTAPLHYLWYDPAGTLIPSATTSTLTLSNVQPANAGSYFVLVTNSFGFAQSSNAVLTVNSGGGGTNTCTPPPSGLVAWWKGQSNTLDSAGSNNGTVVNGSIAYAAGEVGKAFRYTNNSGYVTVAASPSLNVGQGSGFTLEAWIQPADLVNEMPIFEWQYNTNNDFNGAHFWVSSINGPGCLFANVVDSSNTSHWIYSSPGILTSNYQHVALTYDKASGVASIYRNGVLVVSNSIGSFTPYTTGNLLLGERTFLGGQPTHHYLGGLDEMSVYSRALSQSEIAAIYNAGSAGKCDSTNSGGAPAIGLVLPNYCVSNQIVTADGSLNQPLREQMVYGASQFPSNPIVITQIRWRPDTTVGGPVSVTISNLQIKLSTTVKTPDHLSTVFTQNTGVDETAVFSGVASISTAFTTLSNGTKAFDISLPLQTPFVYDPSKGNLLVDLLDLSGSTPPRTPQYNIVNGTGGNDAVSRVFSVNPNATNAETADTGGDVLQIIYTNAPIAVGTAPVITHQPTNQTVAAGANATFSVTATGTAPLHYQWYGPASALIPGATASALTLSNVQPANAGNYFVLVTNQFGSAQSSNAVLTVTGGGGGTNSCTPPPSGIVSWWPGEGNGNDVVGNNNAILENGVTFAGGKVGQSFQLLNASNGWMHVPASPSLDVGVGAGFTVEGWINVTSVDGFHPIFEWHGATRYDAGVQLWLNSNPWESGALFGSVVETNHTTHNLLSADGIVQPNVFQHVALTYDKASGLAKVYLNGTVVAQTAAGNIVPLTGADLYFGHRPLDVPGDWTYGTTLGGSLDEFAVYNRALASNEIAAIYNAGSNGKCGVTNSGGAPAIGLVLPNYSISNQVFNPAGTLNQPLREQMVYGASQFPSNPIVITELRWRPDVNVGGPLSVVVSNLQVKLSTTVATPDHLSTTFNQNKGTNETVVFSGVASISTAFNTLSNGTKAFDISLTLQTPFLFDPSKGNLLVDVLNLNGCTPPRTPQFNIVNSTGLNDAVSRVFSVDPNATNAETADTGGDVLQIIYTNAPAGGGGTNSCTPPPSGIISWWPGEGSGTDAVGSNNVILESGVTFAAGKVGQSFQLLNSSNGWMHLPASSSLDVGAGDGLTVEGWINVSSVDGFHPIVEWHGATRYDAGVQLWINSNPWQSGALFASIVETNHNTHNLLSADGIVQPNVFQHVALTYDKASGLAKVYLNGAVVAQSNVGNVMPLTAADLYFGHRPLDVPGDWTYGTTLGGSLDEFAVYSRALGSNEIAAIYNAGSNGKCSPQIESHVAINPQPVVNMSASGKSIILTWPKAAGAFVLQATDDLTPPVHWTNVLVTVESVGDNIEAALPNNGKQGYFRLYHP